MLSFDSYDDDYYEDDFCDNYYRYKKSLVKFRKDEPVKHNKKNPIGKQRKYKQEEQGYMDD